MILDHGVATDRHVSGYTNTTVTDINNNLEMVGGSLYWDRNGLATKLRWNNNDLQLLGINDAGDVLGQVSTSLDSHPVLLTHAGPKQPPSLRVPGSNHLARTIMGGLSLNELGDVVLSLGSSDHHTAVYAWHPYSSTNEATLVDGLQGAAAINDLGHVAGVLPPDYHHPARSRAARWDGPGQVVDLSDPSWSLSVANAINDQDVIAGQFNVPAPGGPDIVHPALWDRDGAVLDLLQPGWDAGWFTDINNRGEAVGILQRNDGTVAGFLATPVLEPPSAALLLGAVGLLMWWRVRRTAVCGSGCFLVDRGNP